MRFIKFLRQAMESMRFAWHALKSNLLRTMLSLLGVTVGIFAIVAVFTLVDSMERNIKASVEEFGNSVLYVQKWPWGFGGEYSWWKYFQWPEVKYDDYVFLADNLKGAAAVAVFDGRENVPFKNTTNTLVGSVLGVSHRYAEVNTVKIKNGRYFTQTETDNARNVTIIGATVAEELFPNTDPIGKEIKVQGYKFRVIGVQEKKGESMMDFDGGPDEKCVIPYSLFRKVFAPRAWNSVDIVAKGIDNDPGLHELEAEITGLLRTKRGLKPTQENNFSINRPDALMSALDQMFAVISLAGWVIGSFSILVGGFGIANIMFVSVKERTNLIGIQKSLGAKNYFILLQFLFEAVLLSLVGGIVGILLVFLISQAPLGTGFTVTLQVQNIIMGLGISTIIGVVSGIVPALLAARLDPVIAIRS